ncbi:MAG: hypothetical protein ABRQ38_15215 [Candidatus Eremiobacterota bacterium]
MNINQVIITMFLLLILSLMSSCCCCTTSQETPSISSDSTNSNHSNANTGWIKASSNIWGGVDLYYGAGENKQYVGKVLGGNENYKSPDGSTFRGLKIITGGSIEWKDRHTIIMGEYYIKANDPALTAKKWEVYED